MEGGKEGEIRVKKKNVGKLKKGKKITDKMNDEERREGRNKDENPIRVEYVTKIKREEEENIKTK